MSCPADGNGLAAAAGAGGTARVPVTVEVARLPEQVRRLREDEVRACALELVQAQSGLRTGRLALPPSLATCVLYIRCEVLGNDDETAADVAPEAAEITLHIYTLHTEEDDIEELQPDGEDGGGAPVSAGTSCMLPHVRLDLLSENLFYEPSVKSSVLDYATAALRFAQCGIPAEVVSCNRLILLHGPPGTGKTTFCKAIAQQLSIRMRDTFTSSKLMEINSHSLFSKWFSESGKLVMRLFERVREELEDAPHMLLCILIDEVESIASSRSHGGSDPQDAVRAGNAVLTQLDRLKRFPNVLVLCTSNLTNMIDDAFADRVDLKQYIGPPNLEARYEILRSQMEAMVKVPAGSSGAAGLLRDDLGLVLPLPPFRHLATPAALAKHSPTQIAVAQQIRQIALQCESCGGRILRRAPLRCYQLFLTQLCGRQATMSLSQFLSALPSAIRKERGEIECLRKGEDAVAPLSSAAPSAATNGHAPMAVGDDQPM